MKKLIIASVLIATSGCHNVPAWQQSMFDHPKGGADRYQPLYIKGWRDGCESGAQASATHFYRARYKFRQDWQLLDNTEYRLGWDDAYNHCRKYILRHNLEIYEAKIQPEGLHGWHMTWGSTTR